MKVRGRLAIAGALAASACADDSASPSVLAPKDVRVQFEASAPTSHSESGASPSSERLWNGVDLTAWDGDPKIWHVTTDAIEGYAPAGTVTRGTFLIYTGGAPGDFTLTVDVSVEGDGNSGIQYRSAVIDRATWFVQGYQADIGSTFWGDLYEDGGRATLAHGSVPCKQ